MTADELATITRVARDLAAGGVGSIGFELPLATALLAAQRDADRYRKALADLLDANDYRSLAELQRAITTAREVLG